MPYLLSSVRMLCQIFEYCSYVAHDPLPFVLVPPSLYVAQLCSDRYRLELLAERVSQLKLCDYPSIQVKWRD